MTSYSISIRVAVVAPMVLVTSLANAQVQPVASRAAAPGAASRAPADVRPTANPDGDPDASYWRRSREGWFWYQDPQLVKPSPEPAAPPPPPPATEPVPDKFGDGLDRDLADLKDFQMRLERALNAATQNPSERNVALFLELWAKARNKASAFTDIAQTVAVRMPWVDETAQGTRPTNPVAQRIFDQEQQSQRDALLRSLSNNHGLYFFFRSDCAYCHGQVPMLKQLEAKYGFTIFAVSMDGGPIPGFPRATRDNGIAAQIAQAMGMPAEQFQVPFTVLANPTTREVLPVGYGTMTADEMADRIALVVRMRNESAQQALVDNVPSARRGLRPVVASAVNMNQQGVRP